jgi:hypothetical protein
MLTVGHPLSLVALRPGQVPAASPPGRWRGGPDGLERTSDIASRQFAKDICKGHVPALCIDLETAADQVQQLCAQRRHRAVPNYLDSFVFVFCQRGVASSG